MSRRASSTISPIWIGALILLVAAAISCGYFLVGGVNDPYRTLSPLSISAYLENSNSLRGNSYKITGTVWNSLAWSSMMGRLFSIEIESGTGTSDILPVLIPAVFNSQNIQKGQRFIFKIEVDEKGILKVAGLKKV